MKIQYLWMACALTVGCGDRTKKTTSPVDAGNTLEMAIQDMQRTTPDVGIDAQVVDADSFSFSSRQVALHPTGATQKCRPKL